MIDIIANKYFHLYNTKVSYLFYIMPNKQLGHLYYGKNLGKLSMQDLTYISFHQNKASGTVKYSPVIKNFTLADRMQEMPVYGTSDFREGTIQIEKDGEILYPDFEFESYKITYGKSRNLDYPRSYGNDAETLTVKLLDQEHELELNLNYTIFDHNSAIVRSSEIKNLSQNRLFLRNLQSLCLDLPQSNYNFLQLSGAWIKERHIRTRPLEQGIVKVESLRGASSHQENPFVALVSKQVTNNTGEIYASNLIYSGNFMSQVEVDEWGVSRLMTGINPKTFNWQLNSKEVFKTPEAVLFFTDSGYNDLMAETHGFVKNHIVDKKWQKKKRPIVINSWEACVFDFNEDKLLTLAKKAKKLGMECFVLDDGWFGQRNNDHTSLGNWSVNKKKFPQGLEHFSQQLHNMGLDFGLWFEPEMVSPDTNLYKKHPDWIVHHPYLRYSIGRGQYVLDFTNPDVVENIYVQMKKIIESAHVNYIKWDMNRNITEAYSPYLKRKGRPQGEFFHRYIEGVYNLYKKLLTEFPDILIEGCASGGGRFDLGILYYSPQIWPSDDSDATERLDIMSGTLLAYPLSSFSNHVSAIPNGQVLRKSSLKFRQNFADFGPLGYELDLNLISAKDEELIKNNISWYKKKRNLLVNGEFNQLNIFNDSNTYAWSVSSQSEQIVGFFRKLAKPNESLDQYIQLKNIKPNINYQINKQIIIHGKILQTMGLREPYQFNGSNNDTAILKGDFQSYLYNIVKI